MHSINKYETLGIFGSIAVMAIALALITQKTDDRITQQPAQETQVGSVVTTSDTKSLAHTLHDVAGNDNQLQEVVIDDVTFGTGEAVAIGDTVRVHYIGSTQDGVQFDNSYVRGEPFTFTVGEQKVIEGWERGIQGMQVGGERVLVIPPKYAYGNRQVGPIAANSTLVFVVELLAIE